MFAGEENTRHKPKLASYFQREPLEIDNLDISTDLRYQHPRFVCHSCLLKIQRYKKGRSKKQSKLPKDKGKFFQFSSHEEYLKKIGNCFVCSHTQRQSPRKREPESFGEKPYPGVSCTKKSCVRDIFYSPHPTANSNQSNESGSSFENPKNCTVSPEKNQLNADPFKDDIHPLPGILLERLTEREFA